MRWPSLSAALMLVMLTGCGEAPPAPPPAAPATPQGREETRTLEAAGAAGYDGAALRRSADKMLDERDRQAKELEEVQAPPSSGESTDEAK